MDRTYRIRQDQAEADPLVRPAFALPRPAADTTHRH
jgi:hypothetical protein